MKEETENALEQWAAWSKDGFPAISYKHKASFTIDKTKYGYCITEKDAMRVDEIVSSLEAPVKQFVNDYYIKRYSLYRIAIQYKIRKADACALRSTALYDVEKQLFKS